MLRAQEFIQSLRKGEARKKEKNGKRGREDGGTGKGGKNSELGLRTSTR